MDSIRDLLRPAAQLAEDLHIVRAELVNPVHAAAIVDLLDHYARERMGIGRPLSDEVKQKLIPGLRAHPAKLVYLAYLGEEAVGVIICFRGYSTFHAQPLVNIHDFCVKRPYRGRRIGRELLRRVEAKARALGCCRITLEVREDNDRALQLYESDGFEGQRSRDGRPRTLFLEKPLLAKPG